MEALTAVEELDRAAALSEAQPVFLFKHSTACPVSASAYARVAQYLESAGERAPTVFLVNVIESRPVSNEIAARFGVTHQSPQAILLRKGAAVWDASHGGITAEEMTAALG